MKSRICTGLCIGVALLTIDLSRLMGLALIAQESLWFTSLPDLDARNVSGDLVNLPPMPGADSTVVISGEGMICTLNELRAPVNPIAPFGSAFRGALSFAVGARDEFSDYLLAGTADPSEHPIVAYRMGPPPTKLGEDVIPELQSGGFRAAVGNVDGDATSEVLFATGPGTPSTVYVIPLDDGDELAFTPFADYSGGVFVTTGDINGNGYDDVIVAQERGGEIKVFEISRGQAHERGRGRPYGAAYNGGVRVAAFDVNNDGRAEIVTGPVTGPPRVRVFDVSINGGRVFADFRVSDQEAPGGVRVSAGRFGGRPVVLAAHGRAIYEFRITDPAPNVRFFNENPFAVVGSIFIDIATVTPAASGTRWLR
jgi:hypothetical protein